MKISPYLHIVAASLLLFSYASGAETVRSLTDANHPWSAMLEEDVVSTLRRYFGMVRSLEFHSQQETVINNPDHERYVERVHYIGQGPHFKYTASQDTGGKATDGEYTVAFDGKYAQFLTGGMLSLKRDERTGDYPLINRQGFFEPFAFFLSEKSNKTKRDQPLLPTLADFQREGSWAAIAEALPTASLTKRNGVECLLVEVLGGLVPATRSDSLFKIYFATGHGFFPMEWERAARDGSFRYIYEVKELGEVKVAGGTQTLVYPKKAIRSKYIGSSKEPYLQTVITVQDPKIGDPLEEDQFSIDPASARLIYDADEKAFIPVPK